MNKQEYEELFQTNAQAQQAYCKFTKQQDALPRIAPSNIADLARPTNYYMVEQLNEQTEQLKDVAGALEKLDNLQRIADAAEKRSETALTETEHTKQIAESLEEQLKLAEKAATQAKKEARWANIKSWSAGIIAVVSLVCSLLVNADVLFDNVKKILSYLGWLG